MAILKNVNFVTKTVFATFRRLFKNFGLLFIPTSGHTDCVTIVSLDDFLECFLQEARIWLKRMSLENSKSSFLHGKP